MLAITLLGVCQSSLQINAMQNQQRYPIRTIASVCSLIGGAFACGLSVHKFQQNTKKKAEIGKIELHNESFQQIDEIMVNKDNRNRGKGGAGKKSELDHHIDNLDVDDATKENLKKWTPNVAWYGYFQKDQNQKFIPKNAVGSGDNDFNKANKFIDVINNLQRKEVPEFKSNRTKTALGFGLGFTSFGLGLYGLLGKRK